MNKWTSYQQGTQNHRRRLAPSRPGSSASTSRRATAKLDCGKSRTPRKCKERTKQVAKIPRERINRCRGSWSHSLFIVVMSTDCTSSSKASMASVMSSTPTWSIPSRNVVRGQNQKGEGGRRFETKHDEKRVRHAMVVRHVCALEVRGLLSLIRELIPQGTLWLAKRT